MVRVFKDSASSLEFASDYNDHTDLMNLDMNLKDLLDSTPPAQDKKEKSPP